MYLCLGNDRPRWQKLVDKYELAGNHYYLDNQQQGVYDKFPFGKNFLN